MMHFFRFCFWAAVAASSQALQTLQVLSDQNLRSDYDAELRAAGARGCLHSECRSMQHAAA